MKETEISYLSHFPFGVILISKDEGYANNWWPPSSQTMQPVITGTPKALKQG